MLNVESGVMKSYTKDGRLLDKVNQNNNIAFFVDPFAYIPLKAA